MMETKKIKILYIEDNASNRNLVRYILEPEIFEYYESEDAMTGIEKAKDILPNLILMDINMVGMSGTEATIKIKEINELAHVPIIAVTAKILQGDREKFLAAGCSGYIPKPIDVNSFQDKVLEIYRGRSETLSEKESIEFLKKNQAEIVQHLEKEILKLEESRQMLNEKVAELESKHYELKETQQMLIHSEKLAVAGQLVAGIIHEIRTPLTGIMGYHQLLKMKMDDPVLLGYLEHCVNAVNKIKNIVSDMLNFAKRGEEMVGEVNISKIFKSMESLINIMSKQEGMKIDLQHPDEEFQIRGNSGQIEQIVMGLINNAIHAVKKAKSGISRATPGVTISAERSTDLKNIVIKVKDIGTGIAPEVTNRIFEPFFTTKNIDEGTGLGLSICKTIVEAFKGDIAVESKEGFGTTFIIKFPELKLKIG